jgi:hypothetical protein
VDHQRILAWSETHLERLEGATSAFIKQHPAVLVTKYDGTTGENIVTLRLRRLPIMDEWTFMIGDTLHNMRVALDYLTFQIVKPPLTDMRLVKRTQFPICDARDDWAGLAGNRLPGVSDDVRNAFEDLQPYHGRHSPRLEPLLVLDALENVHKHRHLLDAFPAITSQGFTGDSSKIRFTTTGIPIGPLENGVELYRYVFVDPNDTKTELKFQAVTDVRFDRDGPARGHVVVAALKEIRDHIRNEVFPKLEPFL